MNIFFFTERVASLVAQTASLSSALHKALHRAYYITSPSITSPLGVKVGGICGLIVC